MEGLPVFQRELMLIQQIDRKVRRFMDQFVQPHGITPIQGHVLALIETGGGTATVGYINEEIGMGQANVSTLCKKLEGMGLITRRRSTRDERVVLLDLTERGRETMDGVRREIERGRELFQSLPQQLREDVNRGLAAMGQVMDMFEAHMKQEKG